MTTMGGMMMAMATTEPAGGRAFLSRLAGGVRIRILASYVILLALAALFSVLVVRQALHVRLDDRVEQDLEQEVQEFRRLAGGTDPETGRPFGANVRRIFTVYLERNVPGSGELLLGVPPSGVARFRASERADVLPDPAHIARWRALEETEEGELDTEAGPARYTAIPLAVPDGRPRGSFVVAHFTAGEREEVDAAVRIVAVVAAGVLLLGTVVAFVAAGRVLAPLRELRDAARSVSGADMTRRIDVSGTDELADLARTFNRMLERLEFAFASQRDFIRDISHELRTPIAVIRGHLELIREGALASATERMGALDLVTRELDRTSGFVDDLLLLAKTEQPDFLRLETVPIRTLCEELIENARGLARREWALEAGTRRSIVADPQRLTQAMMNLVRNAIEHTSKGDEIAIGGSTNSHVASLWVRDSGVGIPPDEQRRIFERFERGRESGRRYEGSGLGLAIVVAIAEAHAGRVRVESRLGEGATFTIEVPVDGPEAEEAPAP
jgi:two-component system, OmpR family, sensor kinase